MHTGEKAEAAGGAQRTAMSLKHPEARKNRPTLPTMYTSRELMGERV
jgi:hypothetical protein